MNSVASFLPRSDYATHISHSRLILPQPTDRWTDKLHENGPMTSDMDSNYRGDESDAGSYFKVVILIVLEERERKRQRVCLLRNMGLCIIQWVSSVRRRTEAGAEDTTAS